MKIRRFDDLAMPERRVIEILIRRYSIRLFLKPWSWPYWSRRYVALSAGVGPFGLNVLTR
jgi:hypothetical protein